MGYKAGAAENSSSQSQPLQDGTQVFYGAGSAAEANAQVIANVMGVQTITSLTSLPAGHVEVLLGSQVTAQSPGLEMFGADSVNASDYVSAAQQNGQSVPANAQAAANVGLPSDVPAYSQARNKPSASSGSTSSGSAGSPSKSSSVSPKSSSSSAKKPAISSSSSDHNLPYGLTTCPY